MNRSASTLSIPQWKVWLLATRPKTLTASAAPVMIGTSLAYADIGIINWVLVLCSFFGAVLIQIGTNLINDSLDYKKGADTAERIGPMRVTQMGLVAPNQVLAVGFACFAVALLFTVPLIFAGGLPIVAVLTASLLCGYLYTGGPYPLAYFGMGDLFVLLFFGLIGTITVYYLQTADVTVSSLVAGVQIGLLATTLIAINNLRDKEQDVKAKKNTLAVRLGKEGSRCEIAALLMIPFALNGYWAYQGYYFAALLPLLILPVAIQLCINVFRTEPSAEYNQFLASSALVHFFFGILLTLGVWIQ